MVLESQLVLRRKGSLDLLHVFDAALVGLILVHRRRLTQMQTSQLISLFFLIALLLFGFLLNLIDTSLHVLLHLCQLPFLQLAFDKRSIDARIRFICLICLIYFHELVYQLIITHRFLVVNLILQPVLLTKIVKVHQPLPLHFLLIATLNLQLELTLLFFFSIKLLKLFQHE